MRHLACATFWLATLSGAAAAAEIPAELPATDIPNYVKVEPRLAVGGQPSEATLKRLADMGFATVVNIRVPGEKGFVDEEQVVTGQKVRYVSIPVTPDTLSVSDAKALDAALGEKSGAVLVHCASGNRVGGVFMVLAAYRGKSLEDAEAEGRKCGLKSPAMLEAARRVGTEIKPAGAPPKER